MTANCQEFEELIDRMGAGEATAAERGRLLSHIDTCAPCAACYELVAALGAEAPEAANAGEVAAPDLERVRRAVLRRIAEEAAAGPVARTLRGLGWRWQPAWAAACAAVLFAGGWVVGRLPSTSGDPVAPGSGDRVVAFDPRDPRDQTAFARDVRRVAASHQRFEDSADSPFAYSNVELRELGGGRYRLAFDAARHLELEVTPGDPLLSEVLVQSLVGGSPVGTRLNAVALAESPLDARVREALLVAMRHDENLGVRLAAQERLLPERGDRAVEAAMLEVLSAEPAVEMRLRAIDYLAGGGIAAERIEHAMAAAPVNRYLLARAGEVLQSNPNPKGEVR